MDRRGALLEAEIAVNGDPYHTTPALRIADYGAGYFVIAVDDVAHPELGTTKRRAIAEQMLRTYDRQAAAGMPLGAPWVDEATIDLAYAEEVARQREQALEIESLKKQIAELADDNHRRRQQRQAAAQVSAASRYANAEAWKEYAKPLALDLHSEFLAAGHQPDRICMPIATRILNTAKGDKEASKLTWPQVPTIARFVCEVLNPE